jgi:hypothetical protein
VGRDLRSNKIAVLKKAHAMTDHDFYVEAYALAQRLLGRHLQTMEEQALQMALANAWAKGEPRTLETAMKVLRQLQADTGRSL